MPRYSYYVEVHDSKGKYGSSTGGDIEAKSSRTAKKIAREEAERHWSHVWHTFEKVKIEVFEK